jgi:hypothetical protein
MVHTHTRLEIDGLNKLQRITEAMLTDYEKAWKIEMMRRALAAYYRQGGTRMPCKHLSRIAKHKNKRYAYLADETGTLAVYRITGERSFRRKAKTWPKAIETVSMFRQGMILYKAQQGAALATHVVMDKAA